MKRISIALFLFLSLALSQAFAMDLTEGTFFGSSSGTKNLIELHLKEYPGRQGSFLGIIIKDDNQGFAYLVDKYSDGNYGLIPLQTMSNAVVGVSNSNPSLSLSLVSEKKRTVINILSNNSDNKLGFNETMKFEFYDNSSRSSLVSTLSGTFANRAATVTLQNKDNESSLTLNLSNVSGEFALREVRPSLHLALKRSMTNFGVEVSDDTTTMAFFLKRGGAFRSSEYLVLMKSITGELTFLKKL